MSEALLQVRALSKHYAIKSGLFFGRKMMRAVDDVSFDVRRGETFAIVGESGCGKSTTARMISGLLDPTAGSIRNLGREIAGLRGRAAFELRRRTQMVFQDPMASLNPRMKIGAILEEPLIIHGNGDRAARRGRVEELLGLVGLPPDYVNRYPHQFSGGQKQRIGIARALAVEPELLVLDEPVSALDVSVQAQIINLLKDLQAALGLSYVFIAHDLAVVKHMADQVAVMYLGRIVEQGTKDELFAAPRHPYTRMLFSAVPQVGVVPTRGGPRVKGEMPSPVNSPKGCHFHPRCPFVIEACRQTAPQLVETDGGKVACLRAAELPPYERSGEKRAYAAGAIRRMKLYETLRQAQESNLEQRR